MPLDPKSIPKEERPPPSESSEEEDSQNSSAADEIDAPRDVEGETGALPCTDLVNSPQTSPDFSELGASSFPPLPIRLSSSSFSSSCSSSDLKMKDLEHFDETLQSYPKTKELPGELSPERISTAKRCLWDVNKSEVNESLDKELKSLQKAESSKSAKYNFDFDKEVPLIGGDYVWQKAHDAPDFYREKAYPKKKIVKSRFTPYSRPSTSSRTTRAKTSLSSTLVTSTTESSSTSLPITPSPVELATPDLNTKDNSKLIAKASLESSEKTRVSSEGQDSYESSTVSSSSNINLQLSVTSTPSISVTSTSSFKTSVPVTTKATSSLTATSQTETYPKTTNNNVNPISVPPSLFYSTSSITSTSKEHKQKSESETTITTTTTTSTCSSSSSSSSNSDNLRTCRSPEKKRLRSSKNSSNGGSSSTTPSTLLKYYR